MEVTWIGCTSYAFSEEDIEPTRGTKGVETIIFTVANRLRVKNLFNVCGDCIFVVHKETLGLYIHIAVLD
jgi:hypothetical protein